MTVKKNDIIDIRWDVKGKIIFDKVKYLGEVYLDPIDNKEYYGFENIYNGNHYWFTTKQLKSMTDNNANIFEDSLDLPDDDFEEDIPF